MSNGAILWCPLGSDPPPTHPPIPTPPKLSNPHMAFSPHGGIQSVSPFLPKLSSPDDMLPKNHMKYPLHQIYKFSVQGYVAIVSVLI